MLANRPLTDEEVRALQRAEEARRIANNEFETRSALVRRGNDGQLISTAPEDARGRERHIQRLEKERDTQRALHEHAVERSRVEHAQAIARDRDRHVERNRQVLERDLGRVSGLSRLEHSADFHREVERFERDTERELDRYGSERGDTYSNDYLESRERYLRAVDDEKNRLLARDYAANEEDKVRLADRTIEDSERKRIFQAKQSRETAIDRLKNEAERARDSDKLAADRLAAIDAKERSEPIVDGKFLDQATRLDIQLRFEQADRTYQMQDKLSWMASRTSQYREQHEARAYQAHNDRLAEQQRLVEFDRSLNNQWTLTADERQRQYGDELQRRKAEENRLVAEKSAELQREAERQREVERNRPSALDLWAQELEAKERGRNKDEPDRQATQQPEKDKRAGQEEGRATREPERDDARQPQREVKPPEPKPIQDYVHKLERDRVVYSKAAEPDKQAFADYGRRIAMLDPKDEQNRRAALTLAGERFQGAISVRGSEDYKRAMAETAHQMRMQDRIKNPELKDYFKQLDAQKQERERAERERTAAQARDKSAEQAKQPEKARVLEPSRADAHAPEQKPAEPDRKAPEKAAVPERAPARAEQASERAASTEPVRANGTQEPARAEPAQDWRAMSHSDHLQQHAQNEARLQRDVAQAHQMAHEPRPVREDEPKVAPAAPREPEPVAAVAPSKEADKQYDWGPGARDPSDAELDKLARERAQQADLGHVQAPNEPAPSASQAPERDADAEATPVTAQAEPERDVEPETQASAPTPTQDHDLEEDHWAVFASGMESSNNAGRDHERDHDLDQEQGLQR